MTGMMMNEGSQGSNDRFAGAEGKRVVTYDDEILGVVERVVETDGVPSKRYLVVKGDLFGTGQYFVPDAEIERVGPERILLGITRDDLRELDWLNPPPGVSDDL